MINLQMTINIFKLNDELLDNKIEELKNKILIIKNEKIELSENEIKKTI